MEDRPESDCTRESRRKRRRRRPRVCGYRKLTRPPRPVIQVPQSLTLYWLKRAERRVCGRLASELKECGLIPSEWEALREIYQSRQAGKAGRTSPLALARALKMSKGGASKLIDRLVKRKLLRKKVADFDRRSRVVGLTMKGEELVPYLSILEFSTDFEAFRSLGVKMQRRLLEALKVVVSGRRQLPTMEISRTAKTPPPQAPAPENDPAKDVDPGRDLLDWCARFC